MSFCKEFNAKTQTYKVCSIPPVSEPVCSIIALLKG